MELPIYLIGYMGAGKTTVGKLLAQKLGWHFVDLDDAFAEINGMSVAEFVRLYGIKSFRKREKDCVETLSELPLQKVIYATGGGYPCWEDNMECLKELGTSIYLRWANHDLARRVELSGTENRPILRGKKGEELRQFIEWQMSGRESYYNQADIIIDAPISGGLAEENDEEIAEYISNLILDN